MSDSGVATTSDVKSSPRVVPEGSEPTVGHGVLKVTQPYRLQEWVKPEDKILTKYLQYPNLAAELKKLGFEYELTMEEERWVRFEDDVTKSSRKVEIRQVARIVAPDIMDNNKKKEWLVWHYLLTGKNKRGEDASGSGCYLSAGIGKYQPFKEKKNEDGETTGVKLDGTPKEYYTVPFTKEKLEEILQDQDISKIQFTFDDGAKSFGGYSVEELLECDRAELLTRGICGTAGFPITESYASISPKDKLGLMQKSRQK